MNLRVAGLVVIVGLAAGCAKHAAAPMANSVVRADGGVGADLFISIHHNATSNRSVNYTTIWYHGSVDDNEPDLDPARYIAHAIGRHIRTQVAKTAPVLSSQLMYDG